jgi:hypothetical protein
MLAKKIFQETKAPYRASDKTGHRYGMEVVHATLDMAKQCKKFSMSRVNCSTSPARLSRSACKRCMNGAVGISCLGLCARMLSLF